MMININDKSKCCGCHSCYNVCPMKAISMEKDSEGFLYPFIDTSKCVDCGLCEKVCSFLKNEPLRSKKPKTYAAKNCNDEIRNLSSSGGIFSVLSEFVFKANGVVYGVAMDDTQRNAEFVRIDNNDELWKLRGSKYLQSSVGNAYQSVKKDLQNGCKVLFSGVPCQINGLKCFLGREYDNLFTVEVICHGSSSPELWSRYIDYIENKYGAKVQKVNFREKRNGWKKFGLTADGENVSQYLSLNDDPYMRMFLRNFSLRPSCYSCNAKNLESMADLTIADFWGIQNVMPEMDDDKGTSLVLVHTEKGERMLNETAEMYVCKEVLYEQGVRQNPSYHSSVNMPDERKNFFEDMNSMTFGQLKEKYCKTTKASLARKCLNKVKRMVKRILRGGVNSNSSKFEYGLLIILKR